MGANLAGSSFFTALNNGFVSALISFLRTLLFQIADVLVFCPGFSVWTAFGFRGLCRSCVHFVWLRCVFVCAAKNTDMFDFARLFEKVICIKHAHLLQ
ncbi:MAG: hypothetical protein II811_01370, partial [Spirochaetaceae bacterium]|nr:hypothetical protein [Spirochaetaceae bacterium]